MVKFTQIIEPLAHPERFGGKDDQAFARSLRRAWKDESTEALTIAVQTLYALANYSW